MLLTQDMVLDYTNLMVDMVDMVLMVLQDLVLIVDLVDQDMFQELFHNNNLLNKHKTMFKMLTMISQ